MMGAVDKFNDWMEKQLTPPRPGLVFDRQKHRWVRPEGQKTTEEVPEVRDPSEFTIRHLEEIVDKVTEEEARKILEYATEKLPELERKYGRYHSYYKDYDNVAFLARRRLRRLKSE